jgi:uncharacterized protein
VSDRNPFDYGGPVTGEHFTGRKRELVAVVSRLRDHVGVAVTAPRRYGKSSLINQACAQLAATSPPPAIVSVNLLRAASLPAFAGVLLRRLYTVPGGPWHRMRQVVPGFLARINVVPRVVFDQTGQPSFEFVPGLASEDAERIVADVFAVLDEIGERRPSVLVLDEFQAVSDLSHHLPSLLKALADEHRKVSLVVAGSKEHLMASLVTAKGAPLYNMLEHVALGPIGEEEWISFLVARARSGERPFADLECARSLWEIAAPVPFDVQQLAYEAFNQAAVEIDLAAVERAVAELVHHEAANYARAFEKLSPGQRRVLKILAEGALSTPGSSRFAVAAGLADATSVRKAINVLVEAELVVWREGVPAIDDPFLGAWLRRGDLGLE